MIRLLVIGCNGERVGWGNVSLFQQCLTLACLTESFSLLRRDFLWRLSPFCQLAVLSDGVRKDRIQHEKPLYSTFCIDQFLDDINYLILLARALVMSFLIRDDSLIDKILIFHFCHPVIILCRRWLERSEWGSIFTVQGEIRAQLNGLLTGMGKIQRAFMPKVSLNLRGIWFPTAGEYTKFKYFYI